MADEYLSSLLLDLPSITGAFMVAHAIGDIVTGDVVEPEVVVSVSPSVGGLLDSLTGNIGISGISPRAEPVAAPVASSTPSGTAVIGALASDVPKIGSRLLDKDALRSFISSAMPFGWYFFIMINCRAELEGLPDVSFPLTGLSTKMEVLSFHPCAQVPEQNVDKQALMFSPPLGNFVLMRYQATCGIGPPVKGFYQLSMVSEDEGAFLFKLHLMEGYKSPLTMEFCNVTMPFPRRRVLSFDGTPSIGTVSNAEHSVEWKIITSGRGLSGKSIDATFSGTVRFAPWQTQRLTSFRSVFESATDEESDNETESTNNMVNIEEFLMEKMSKDLPPVDLEDHLAGMHTTMLNYDTIQELLKTDCISYPKEKKKAPKEKVSFKIVGASLSGMSIDPKSVSIYPAVKAPVELSTQVTSGDYILWNTLEKCPSAVTAKV
ncbi:hypothetical protein CRYUN_Cryun18bG0020800 [Craigia yunnanensis]